MIKFIKRMTNAAQQFTAIDFAFFKIYLVAVGILICLYFSDFFLKHITIVWVVAVVALIFVMFKLIRYCCGCRYDCKKKD